MKILGVAFNICSALHLNFFVFCNKYIKNVVKIFHVYHENLRELLRFLSGTNPFPGNKQYTVQQDFLDKPVLHN